MIEKSCELAIIGGGPAGITAAITAARGGASVILLDEGHELGGHFFKSLPGNFQGKLNRQDRRNMQELGTRTADLQASGATVYHQAEVWGLFPQDEPAGVEHTPPSGFHILAGHPQHQSISVTARKLILAPGVYDRPLPFPGWELPGVLTPGAVQIMLKKQGLLPGRRVLVAGSGPLQLPVAAALAQGGAQVVAVLEAGGPFDGMGALPAALGGLSSRLGEAAHSFITLGRARVPVYFRQAVFQALGDAHTGVTGAIIGRVDPQGHPLPGSQRTLQVDTIVCAYGFAPAINLTLHLGCEHDYHPYLGAYIPRRDSAMRTNVPGVYLAGDITGVGGKPLAILQGQLAATSALSDLGRITPPEAARQSAHLAPAIRREQRFARWLWSRYRLRSGLLDLVQPDTLVCRCEHVSAGEVLHSLEQGGRDLFGIKLRTRTGMGNCQGRYCMLTAALLLSRQNGIPVEAAGLYSVRPPLAPTRLKNIAAK